MSNPLTELEYLRAFYQEADFGPADSDVRDMINNQIRKDHGGRELPKGYREEE
jgi:hypothetical protein